LGSCSLSVSDRCKISTIHIEGSFHSLSELLLIISNNGYRAIFDVVFRVICFPNLVAGSHCTLNSVPKHVRIVVVVVKHRHGASTVSQSVSQSVRRSYVRMEGIHFAPQIGP
jgi:hypothetical protein